MRLRVTPALSAAVTLVAAVLFALLPPALAVGQTHEAAGEPPSDSPWHHERITPLATLTRQLSMSRTFPQSADDAKGGVKGSGQGDTSDESGAAAKAPTDQTSTEQSQMSQNLVVARTKLTRPQPDASLATAELMPIRIAPSGARFEATLAKLEQPVAEIHFVETPLDEAVAVLADKQGLEIEIDTRSLDDYGIESDLPITLTAADISLESALRRMLRDSDLGFTVHDDGLLMVTTIEEEENHLPIIAYPLPFDDDPGALIPVIQQTIEPTTWNTVGGQGAIFPWRNTLLVSQTMTAHKQLLTFLRRYASAEFPQQAASADGCASGLVLRTYHVADDATRRDLAEQLVSMCNAVLGERGDPSAETSLIGSTLVVRSSSRSFHAYASQVIRSIVGVPTTSIDIIDDTDAGPRNGIGMSMPGRGPMGIRGMGLGGGSF